LIQRRHGTSINPPIVNPESNEFEEYEDDDEETRVVPDIEDTVDASGKLLNQMPANNRILNQKFLFNWERIWPSERLLDVLSALMDELQALMTRTQC
jgi:hypothetical protein